MIEGMELDTILDKALASTKGISISLASSIEVKQWHARLMGHREVDRRAQGRLINLKVGPSRWDCLFFRRQGKELIIEKLDLSKVTIKEL